MSNVCVRMSRDVCEGWVREGGGVSTGKTGRASPAWAPRARPFSMGREGTGGRPQSVNALLCPHPQGEPPRRGRGRPRGSPTNECLASRVDTPQRSDASARRSHGRRRVERRGVFQAGHRALRGPRAADRGRGSRGPQVCSHRHWNAVLMSAPIRWRTRNEYGAVDPAPGRKLRETSSSMSPRQPRTPFQRLVGPSKQGS